MTIDDAIKIYHERKAVNGMMELRTLSETIRIIASDKKNNTLNEFLKRCAEGKL